jgi:Mg/Co/Ni transporter MgtE
MTVSSAANIIERVGSSTVERAIRVMDTNWNIQLFEKVNTDTLMTGLSALAKGSAAKILKEVNSRTFEKALNNMSDAWTAKVLEKMDTRTMKSALKAIKAEKLGRVLSQVGSDVKDAPEDFLKKADPGKLDDMYEKGKNKVKDFLGI